MNGSVTPRGGGQQFSRVRFREGYKIDDVEAFLLEVEDAIGRGEPIGRMVQQARFTPVRLRPGYDMAEVDAYLDRLVEEHPDR